MAQAGYTPILIYSSSTTTNAPAVGNLTNSTLGSELAINITDGKLFYKDNANAIQVIAWKTTPTTAGGTGLTSYTAGDLLYYATGTTLAKLAIGANTTIMTSSGSAPQWTAASSITVGTATNIAGGAAGSVPYQTGAGATSLLAIGASGRYLSSSGSAPQWSAPAALTKTDDTNVTLTLGGSASTALLNAASLTLGWTGTLGVSRGGTGTGTAFTTGSVVFAGASGVYSQDNANLFWDDTNNRLGVGITSPAQSIDTVGTAKARAFLVDANNSTNYDIKLVTTAGDGGTNTVQVYWNATYGAAAAGGCLGAYNRSGTYAAPSATVGGSNEYTIYGFIGVAS
jgi:hypothetical protein